ncbi:TonB-linked outer membrane protein, SusC/RagA family [Mucilaginibacter lappiensis]|uniref:TonB-linked SusC/RagA family outer membrane protein n=1 Tax=Mucilaginibacter lappiensis TaxID=354630 RepID=A0ABR6PNR5_9SPHI|nr:TonB-dependent receptor [Mucilaginibacter lappiensis]MBB6111398.1 TonB-linked SusC/RagA family outer membrane protein [Mucilaginibacter lappiensis]SIR78448.1 TonB-linked outer membrane protein, SusC/RagA family [Mucilaginibacter lappiensis]
MKEIFTYYGGCHGIHYPAKFKGVIRHGIMALLFLLVCSVAMAQTNRTGTVVDETGQGLPGVSVKIKGTTIGTVTSVDGKFTLSVSNDQTLAFTFVGYASQEVAIGSQTSIKVSMVSNATNVNEVVVVGYGTQKKATVTGSIASVTNKEIVTTKNENVLNMLTGKVAGLRIVQNSSEPGSFDNAFDIRGFGNPLVIIDGVPRDNISRLDPNDIESISVLKDASAAIYGVRAANGVVIVTTKKGKKGTVELNYSGTYGWQIPSYMPKPVGAVDYMTLVNEQLLHNVNGGQVKYTDADFAAYRSGAKKSTDWYSPVFANSAPQQQHNLNAIGGTDNSSYFVSMGITDQDGFFKSGDLNYKRYNLRSNLTTKVNKNLTIDVNLSGTLEQKNQPYQDAAWIIRSFWRQIPTQSIYANNNPAYLANGEVDGSNPVAMADADIDGYKQINNKWLQSSVSATYNVPFVQGLSAKGLYNYDYYMSSNKLYQRSYNQYTYDANSQTYSAIANQTPGSLTRQFYEKPTSLMQLSLNYNRAFKGGHNITALALYEESEQKGDNFNAQRQLSLPVDQLGAGNALNQTATVDNNYPYDYITKSFVGRVNYDYKGKYLAEFSFRDDGSSKNSPLKRWGFFPGASVGWRVSQEDFWKKSKALSFIDDLKIRLSYAKLGDDAGLNAYQYLSGYNYPANGDNNQTPPGSVFDGTFVNGAQSRGIPNPYIFWYVAKTYNAGIDLQAWNGLLGLTVDAFRRDRSGLLDTRADNLPGVVGAGLPQENLNSDRAQGFDIELNHRYHIGSFNYFVKGTFGYTRTQWISKVHSEYGNSQLNWHNNNDNRYSNIFWGYGSNGQFQNYQQILNSPQFVSRNAVVGDYILQDWNGDGVINDQDVHPIAQNVSNNNYSVPSTTFGLTLGGSYKGFDISTVWQGATGINVSYIEQLNIPLWGGGSALAMFMDRYHPTDPKADPYDPNTVWTPGTFALTGTTADVNSLSNIHSAAYVRLKSAELGYSITPAVAKRLGIKGARIFVNGYNVLTITNLKYLDPEHPSANYGYLYPLDKIFSVGVNVKL